MNITAIKQQVKQHNRYSIYVDGSYAFSLGDTALLDSRITVGQELDDEQLQTYKQLSSDDKVYGNAMRYVAMRTRSIGEMRDYFTRKKVDGPLAEMIFNKLISLGLLDDEAFARAWVQNRRLLKPTSRRKLQQELQLKHVSSEIIDTILAEDRQETDEQDVLVALIARKRARYADDQKLMQYLSRQGYAYQDVKAALEKSRQD